MTHIECKNLSIGYDSTPIQRDINIKINKGDYLCIIGENGCGKSTLLKTILNLISPLEGEVIFNGRDNDNSIGYLSQVAPHQRDFPASAFEIVLSGFQNKLGKSPFYKKEHKIKAKEVMEKLNVTNLSSMSFSKLSGGQRQRVLLSRALCATQSILLLDEPANNLDPKVTEDLHMMLKQLNSEGTTIVMVSHNMDNVMKYASHVLELGNSRFFGKKEEYFALKDKCSCSCNEISPLEEKHE